MAQLKDLIVNGPSQFIGNANFSSLNISGNMSASSAIITSLTVSSMAVTNINVTSLTSNSITSTDINTNSLTATTANIADLNVTAISISSNSNIGATNLPIYWNEGVPTTITDLVLNGDITSNNISTTNITVGSPREGGTRQLSRIGKIYFTIEEDNGSPLQSERYSYTSISSIGASTLPIYWSNGIPTSITGINLSSGSITANNISVTSINAQSIFSGTNILLSNIVHDISFIDPISGDTTNSISTIGSTSQPIYWNAGTPTAITGLNLTGSITANSIYSTSITANSIYSTTGTIKSLTVTTAIYAKAINTTSISVNDITASGNINFYNTIDGVWLKGNIIHYSNCNTTGSTYTKSVTCPGFNLTTGAKITVKFTNDDTSTSPIELSVYNGTQWLTATTIKYKGNNIEHSLIKANSVYDFIYDGNYFQLIGGAGGSNIKIFSDEETSTAAYYIVGQSGTTANTNDLYKAKGTSASGANSAGIYFTPVDQVLMGAAWNDYAEFRQTKENIEPGRVVKENGDGTLSLATMRLAKGCEIVSDTYGFGIGKSDIATLPIAASGRVLAYPDKKPSLFTIGSPVCSGPNGTVSEMTEEEEAKYPSRIIGTVSEIPDYEIWHGANDIEVNGRIWIRVR